MIYSPFRSSKTLKRHHGSKSIARVRGCGKLSIWRLVMLFLGGLSLVYLLVAVQMRGVHYGPSLNPMIPRRNPLIPREHPTIPLPNPWLPLLKKITHNHSHALHKNMAPGRDADWQVILPDADSPPYSTMTPHFDLIWSRGWYNAVPLPPSIPMAYYNDRNLRDRGMLARDLSQFLNVSTVCETGYLWIRGHDVAFFARKVLPNISCTLVLITSDCVYDAPTFIRGSREILASPLITEWYAQNKAEEHAKLKPIPLGIPVHYGFEGSPHSLFTVQAMVDIRKNAPPFHERQNTILYDKGTMDLTRRSRRSVARNEAIAALSSCNNIQRLGTKIPQEEFWTNMTQHQFGIAVTGVGWDTFRIWEYLFFGTIPIVKRSPLTEFLLEPAHVPVLIVDDWSDVCQLTGDTYEAVVSKYVDWVANAHFWLQPSLWIPRDEVHMEYLCDISPGCRSN